MSLAHPCPDNGPLGHGGDAGVVARFTDRALRRFAQTVEGLPEATMEEILAVVDLFRIAEGVHVGVRDV
ncbi:hypothetical protein AB0H49_17140 [Nocardia sp. NPDC050713]|uniref:hypothetical protein n=1 Tax=unclassified Nocardia TaxID=2637762 RepID=UPI0033BD6902